MDPTWLDALLVVMVTLIALCVVRINSVVTHGINQIVSGLQAIYEEQRKNDS